jgi:4-amino-4-deoxychorismate lyase
VILINGQPDNRIPVSDRGLQYGDGVFETLAFRNGELELLDAHLARLMLGCERLGLAFNEVEKLKLELVTLCAQTSEDSVIKIIVTRGSGGRGYKAPSQPELQRILSTHPMPDYPESCQSGIHVRQCDQRLGLNPALAGIKHLNRLEQVLARSEWDDETVREGLMLDIRERLVEGTMSNLFLVRDGTLLTPPITDAGIAGVMRASVIQLAREAGITVFETVLTLSELASAEEVFVTNSIIQIWPVVKDITSGHSWPHGPLTKRLQSALQDVSV